jgi:hypothetical protein
MPRRLRSGALYVGLIVAVALVAVIVVRVLWTNSDSVVYEHCTVGTYELDPGQAAVASTMVGVVTERALPERAAVLAVAAALQESKLVNLPPNAGDRDSVGVLQQRPSQGWGTEAQLSDLHYATGAFLDALLKVPNWQKLDLASAVQAVQISADGSAYAQHENEAQVLTDRLIGKPPAGISCVFNKPTKVATAAQVAARIRADLPVHTPTAAGLTVTVPGAKWQSAAWFVANAFDLGIDSVAYAGKQWTRAKGWHDLAAASSTAVTATLAKV